MGCCRPTSAKDRTHSKSTLEKGGGSAGRICNKLADHMIQLPRPKEIVSRPRVVLVSLHLSISTNHQLATIEKACQPSSSGSKRESRSVSTTGSC